jgi:hypothetical protein
VASVENRRIHDLGDIADCLSIGRGKHPSDVIDKVGVVLDVRRRKDETFVGTVTD